MAQAKSPKGIYAEYGNLNVGGIYGEEGFRLDLGLFERFKYTDRHSLTLNAGLTYERVKDAFDVLC